MNFLANPTFSESLKLAKWYLLFWLMEIKSGAALLQDEMRMATWNCPRQPTMLKPVSLTSHHCWEADWSHGWGGRWVRLPAHHPTSTSQMTCHICRHTQEVIGQADVKRNPVAGTSEGKASLEVGGKQLWEWVGCDDLKFPPWQMVRTSSSEHKMVE